MTLNALLSSTSMIRVPRPRVLWVRRHLPDRVTVGDTAQSRLDPGTIALLDSPLGAGYLARYNIPVMLASTSAMAILAPACRGGIDWAGRNLEVEWFAVPGDHDVIVAEARLEQFSEQMARFATRGRTETGTVLYRGVLRQVALRDGIPAAYRSREEYEAAMASLARPTVELAAGKLLRVMAAPQSIPLGRSAAIEVEVSNHQRDPVALAVAAHAPFGAGLSFEAPEQQLVQLAPGGTASVRFTVRADRPHEVNLGKPWEARISAGDATVTIPILVPDPNPGRTFYLLTEDCETFDGGPLTGHYAGNEDLGNHNNFMDPEDYRVQMILKPARMNAIAERHGARWTHFYAATQRFAADWAAAQSTTGEWKKVAAEMDAAVRAGSQLHEYAPHIHYDYEPDSALAPQPRLVYDRATDGILPNDYYDPQTNPTHRYHDWDGAARGHSYIKPLGDFTVLDSKAGSMRKYLRHLSRIQANRRAPLVARTGSYDFGTTPEDQAISTEAYATKLMDDVNTLAHGVQTIELQPAQLANGAVELMNEVANSKITGEEDRYSHTDLSDFQGNLSGSEKAFDLLVPALRQTGNATLAASIAARFAAVQRSLDRYKRRTTLGYAPYTQLTLADRKTFAVEIDALDEPLSTVAAKVSSA